MEKNNNINIAEILKDCPKGTKLYSTVFGEVTFDSIDIDEKYPIVVYKLDGMKTLFTEEGHYTGYPNSDRVLFPSSEMRDWRRFFKRGDIIHNTQEISVFESWTDDSYTGFNVTLHCESEELIFDYFEDGPEFNDQFCYLASDKTRTEFIAAAEKYYHGKYNPETLKVEPVKPKCPFKPFDKVLVRDNEGQLWNANYFSYYRENNKDFLYACMDNPYRFCIPYEGNEHLLGTTDPYKEGGSK